MGIALGKLLRAAAFAEPTFSGQVGAGLVHMAMWAWLGDWDIGLMKHIREYVRSKFVHLYTKVLPENYEGDPFLDLFGCQDEPGVLYVWNILTLLHHGSAGALMFAGYLSGHPWIWRHGMLVQLAGMDILDFAKMVACKVRPPGPFPISKGMHSSMYAGFLIFHHSVSLTVGIPVSLYFAHLPAFQWFGVMMTGGPMLMVLPDLLVKTVDAKHTRTHIVQGFWASSIFTYQRLVFCLPATYNLLRSVFQAQLPWYVRASFCVGALNMTLFNILGNTMAWSGVIKKVFEGASAEASEEVPPLPRKESSFLALLPDRAFSASSLLSAEGMAAELERAVSPAHRRG